MSTSYFLPSFPCTSLHFPFAPQYFPQKTRLSSVFAKRTSNNTEFSRFSAKGGRKPKPAKEPAGGGYPLSSSKYPTRRTMIFGAGARLAFQMKTSSGCLSTCTLAGKPETEARHDQHAVLVLRRDRSRDAVFLRWPKSSGVCRWQRATCNRPAAQRRSWLRPLASPSFVLRHWRALCGQTSGAGYL